MALREDVLRRLLVSKRFLERTGLLTPDSDAAAVGGAVLAAHDAVELALNAIAGQLDVVAVKERATMFDLMDAIDASENVSQPLSGRTLLGRLNSARKGLKHNGVFPDPKDFYRIVDQTRDIVDEWCTTHLEGLSLDEINLAVLIEDRDVVQLYQQARACFEVGRFKEALEAIGHALYLVVRRMPGKTFSLGLFGPDTDGALAAASYGVRPSDLLNLQRFLPNVTERHGSVDIEWEPRARGHEGNWREEAVRYCLDVFVDVAVKLQHVQPIPTPWQFFMIFDDVIKAKRDEVAVWIEKLDGLPSPHRTARKEVVKVLSKGEELRGLLRIKKESAFEKILQPEGDDGETIVDVTFEDERGIQLARVLRSDVEILCRPKDSPAVRSVVPHLFRDGTA